MSSKEEKKAPSSLKVKMPTENDEVNERKQAAGNHKVLAEGKVPQVQILAQDVAASTNSNQTNSSSEEKTPTEIEIDELKTKIKKLEDKIEKLDDEIEKVMGKRDAAAKEGNEKQENKHIHELTELRADKRGVEGQIALAEGRLSKLLDFQEGRGDKLRDANILARIENLELRRQVAHRSPFASENGSSRHTRLNTTRKDFKEKIRRFHSLDETRCFITGALDGTKYEVKEKTKTITKKISISASHLIPAKMDVGVSESYAELNFTWRDVWNERNGILLHSKLEEQFEKHRLAFYIDMLDANRIHCLVLDQSLFQERIPGTTLIYENIHDKKFTLPTGNIPFRRALVRRSLDNINVLKAKTQNEDEKNRLREYFNTIRFLLANSPTTRKADSEKSFEEMFLDEQKSKI